MLEYVKELLIQVLLAGLPAFLFPLLYENFDNRMVHISRNQPKMAYCKGFLLSCILSMILCSIFAGQLWGSIPLSFAMLPLFALMLYGTIRIGITAAILQIIVYPWFAVNNTFLGFLLETSCFLYPLVLSASGGFKNMSRNRKIATLSFYFMSGQLILLVSPFVTGDSDIVFSLSHLAFILPTLLLMVLLSSLFVLLIDNTLAKDGLKKEVLQLSRKFMHEAGKLQQMMDVAPISMILLDPQGCIVSINDTFLQLYRKMHPGAIKDELISCRLADTLQGYPFEVPLELLTDKVSNTLKTKPQTTEFIKIGASQFFISITCIHTNSSNEKDGVVIMLQDITELEAMRMELFHAEQLSMVGQMAAGITHEIRNPMAVVRGFLQLMREKSPDDLHHYYRIVMEELDRANSIISDFLSLAQNQVMNKESQTLEEIINELSPLLWADANLRGMSIEVILDNKVPPLLLNVKEIKQVILNLARNAMEAMEDHKGHLLIKTRLIRSEVSLVVQDNGPGIPHDQLGKLFEPFYTTKTKGTGLGLPLCLSIIERHGGRIEVSSEEGAGTTFTVYLPVPLNP